MAGTCLRVASRGAAHLVLPPPVLADLRSFLRERSADGREAFAAVLCGVHRGREGVRLLARHLLLPEEGCFRVRSSGRVSLLPQFDDLLLGMAEKEDLAVVHVHTHLHEGPPSFSAVDDCQEALRSEALSRELGLAMASVVFDRSARHWMSRAWCREDGGRTQPAPLRLVSSLADLLVHGESGADARYDRQVLAFGTAFQSQLSALRVGVVGVGGLGGIVVETLARLGVRRFVLVDPDRVEGSNLNRLVGATPADAAAGRLKVRVARRNVRRMHGRGARVLCFPDALPSSAPPRALAECHILVAAADDHASRLAVQEIGAAFLRPVVHVGVRLDAAGGRVERIDARVAAPPVAGHWCLACGGVIDPLQAVREASDPEHAETLDARGYLPGTPTPAVYWVNQQAAAQAVEAIHELVHPFRDDPGAVGGDRLLDLLHREELMVSHRPAAEGCMVCGPHGLRGLGDAFFRAEEGQLPPLPLGHVDTGGTGTEASVVEAAAAAERAMTQ